VIGSLLDMRVVSAAGRPITNRPQVSNLPHKKRRYPAVFVTPALDSVLMMILMGSVEALCDELDWFVWKAEKSWLSI
jgi:hypothetical protein